LSSQFDEVLKSAARIAHGGVKRAALVSLRSSSSEENILKIYTGNNWHFNFKAEIKLGLGGRHHHHHHHHHHADIYSAPITTKQEHRCSTKIQIVVDETY